MRDYIQFVTDKLGADTPVETIFSELRQLFNENNHGVLFLRMLATSGEQSQVGAIIRVAAKRELRSRGRVV